MSKIYDRNDDGQGNNPSSVKERFANARDSVVLGHTLIEGIGCLSEKTTHAVIKLYLEPDTAYHEQNIYGRMVADIRNEVGIFEVQTASFGKMKKKLEKFLEIDNVTIVYPCIETKYVIWVDSKGEKTARNRRPGKGSPLKVFYELYQIREFLCDKRLRILVFMMDVDEYKLLDGRGKDKKKGATKFDKIPISLNAEYLLENPSDYTELLPPLPDMFKASDLAKAAKVTSTLAYGIINVLVSIGEAEVAKIEGRTRFFRLVSKKAGDCEEK